MEWYYVDRGSQVGPITDDEFSRLVENGTITAETLVWQPGLEHWLPYGELLSPEERNALIPAAEEEREERCAECGQTFPCAEMIAYDEAYVCPACKPVFFQRLKEGVRLPGMFEYGGFWIRLLAKIIDGFILWLVLMPFAMVIGVIQVFTMGDEPNLALAVTLQVLNQIFSIVLAASYDTFFVGRFAATPGKMACGLKVITSDGGKVTYLRALGRHFAEWLSKLTLMIGYVIAAFDDEKRALHDHICNTRVIKK